MFLGSSWAQTISFAFEYFGPRKSLETWALGVTYYYIQLSLDILELHLEDFIVLHLLEAVLGQRDDIMMLYSMFLINQKIILHNELFIYF